MLKKSQKLSAILHTLHGSKGLAKPQYLQLLRHWIIANKKMQRFFNESKTSFSITKQPIKTHRLRQNRVLANSPLGGI